jgi:hypothetical protein
MVLEARTRPVRAAVASELDASADQRTVKRLHAHATLLQVFLQYLAPGASYIGS